MAYLIDGHNLIPKLPGFSLKAIDDEMELVELLQEFCRLQRKEVEIYFDNAPAGQPRARNFGSVIARFVRTGQTADAAIAAHLQRLGKAASNWTVVSSDQAVQASARAARARFVSSEAFAGILHQALTAPSAQEDKKREAALDQSEVDEWLDLFGGEPGNPTKSG